MTDTPDPVSAAAPTAVPPLAAFPPVSQIDPGELREAWVLLLADERMESFRVLSRVDAEDLFLSLPARDQLELIEQSPAAERRSWIRLLPPDDAADVIQCAAESDRAALLALLDESTHREVQALLAYAEDQAGGLMSPRYARVRPEMTVYEAISYLRRQALGELETIYYAYVLDAHQKLMGVVSFRDLFRADNNTPVREVMTTNPVSVQEEMDQESVSRVLADSDLMAVPVVDAEGRMKGIITSDDIVDVVREAATEDMHKVGGMQALEAPYLETALPSMVRKRAPWLAVLFVGQMLTATAIAAFEDEIAKALVLTLFIPLIISSGGNAGSQATTLVIRALALGEARMRDWWRIVRREFITGVVLGALLAVIGLLRVLIWGGTWGSYGEHYVGLGVAVAVSLIAVVTWGALVGSMLPLVLRRFGLDPAAASAPFVATLCDVTGLVIYFSVARLVLTGTLL